MAKTLSLVAMALALRGRSLLALAALVLPTAMLVSPPARAQLTTATVAKVTVAAARVATVTVTRGDGGAMYRADGVVEAERHAELAAQVAGRITAVPVKAGDTVAAGAALVLIDARAAQDQQAVAHAQLNAAQRDYERSRELFAQNYISKAAMDRVEAQYRVLQAQSGIAGTQSDFHRVAAPYAGIVADVLVEVGDMAQPGKPLLSFYDPKLLRVTVQVPETVANEIATKSSAQIEIPSAAAGQRNFIVQQIDVLPTANTSSHTREVRLQLSAGAAVIPGASARVLLPIKVTQTLPLSIPVSSVMTRVEFQGVYVVDAKGHVQLRQVRLGQRLGDRVEVLAGVREGERIAADPLAALRLAQPGVNGGADE